MYVIFFNFDNFSLQINIWESLYVIDLPFKIQDLTKKNMIFVTNYCYLYFLVVTFLTKEKFNFHVFIIKM